MNRLSAEYLRERLHYDPKTGVFTWKTLAGEGRQVKVWNARYSGKQTGSIAKIRGDLCYLQIRVDDKLYQAHRLAWLYMTGKFPREGIDHRDGDGRNNRWENLRLANGTQNQGNRKRNANNTSGFKGVTYLRGRDRYKAAIQVRGKSQFLGHYRSAEAAHAAYMTAAKEHFGEFARAE